MPLIASQVKADSSFSITLSGDVTGTSTVTSNTLSIPTVLGSSGVTAARYGLTSNVSPAFGGTFTVPNITVNAKGIVTAAGNSTVTLPSYSVASTSANGLMSKNDKVKLDGIASGAQAVTYKNIESAMLNQDGTSKNAWVIDNDLFLNIANGAMLYLTPSSNISWENASGNTLLGWISLGTTFNKTTFEVMTMNAGISVVDDDEYVAITGDLRGYTSGYSLGTSSVRWQNCYLMNAVNVSSDERLKTDIDSIPDSVLDAWEEINFAQYKLKASVENKGDDARLHTGLIAQRIQEVFTKHKLNVADYGLFCYDEWEDEYRVDRTVNNDTEGDCKLTVNRTQVLDVPAGNMYSLRYEEIYAIEAAYQRRKVQTLEARIEELEKVIAQLK